MILKNLTKKEIQIVLESLKALADGPFFPDNVFPTYIGFYRSELIELIDNWDTIDPEDQKALDLINNSLNNMTYCPYSIESWYEYMSASMEDLHVIYEKWIEWDDDDE